MLQVYFTIVFGVMVLRFIYTLRTRGSKMTYRMAFLVVLLNYKILCITHVLVWNVII